MCSRHVRASMFKNLWPWYAWACTHSFLFASHAVRWRKSSHIVSMNTCIQSDTLGKDADMSFRAAFCVWSDKWESCTKISQAMHVCISVYNKIFHTCMHTCLLTVARTTTTSSTHTRNVRIYACANHAVLWCGTSYSAPQRRAGSPPANPYNSTCRRSWAWRRLTCARSCCWAATERIRTRRKSK